MRDSISLYFPVKRFTLQDYFFLLALRNKGKLFLFDITVIFEAPEAATQKCSLEKKFWKYAANLQENTYAEVWFQ